MAAPDLNNPTKVEGKVVFTACASTNAVTILSNGSASSACLRISSLMLANVDGTNAVDATVKLYNAATGGTAYSVASTLNVPSDSTVVVIGRDNAIYLEEDRRIEVQASAADDLEVVCSYEAVT
jgi:hypothetical protein